jgi:hypothetical protein
MVPVQTDFLKLHSHTKDFVVEAFLPGRSKAQQNIYIVISCLQLVWSDHYHLT